MGKAELIALCERYISAKAAVIPEHECKSILQKYGVETPAGVFAETAEEAIRFADKQGYPVVVKALSPTLLHKTEMQAVFLNVSSPEELKSDFERLRTGFQERNEELQGIPGGGNGADRRRIHRGRPGRPQLRSGDHAGDRGLLIDMLDDVTFRMLPVNRNDVREMIAELKGRLFLKGYRGAGALNEDALADAVLNIGRLGLDAAGLYKSMDYNPIVVTADGALALDAKIILPQSEKTCGVSQAQPDTTNLDKFFEPRTVALIGASTIPDKIGYVVADSLINHEFAGTVYPITRGGKQIFRLKSLESLRELPEKVDLAVVVVGLALVPEILEHCRELDIRAVLIISGGGKELGGAQAELEKQIQLLAREYGIRVIGPNCIGCFNANTRFDAFFQTHERMVRPRKGNISFITQSGTYGCSFLEEFEHIGVNKMISYGNRVDVDEADMIASLAQDPNTRVLAAYIEGMGDGRKFIQAAREAVFSRAKPIVLYKSGRTKRSAKAAQSHTGAYGGAYKVYEGAFRQAGILTADSFEELVAAVKALSLQNPAAGTGISMISNGAGPMVNAIDMFDKYELEFAELEAFDHQKNGGPFPGILYLSKPGRFDRLGDL